jgi:hypothetical protein
MGFIHFISKIEEEEEMEAGKVKEVEYSVYLILQIFNKVVSEHRYTFREWVCKNNAIPKIAKLSKLKSKLINIEIVKFYKSLMRIKDLIYIQEITKKNLFYPINDIFEMTYDTRNPPMIQSCIRDLYDMILGKSLDRGDNEFPIPKMAFYLTKLDQESKKIIFNDKYTDVFGKYQLGSLDVPDESFLLDGKPKPLSSGGGSPVPEENYNYFEGNTHERRSKKNYFGWEKPIEEEQFENQDFYSPGKKKINLSPLANKESELKKKTSDYLFDLQEDDSEENKKEFIAIQLDKMSEEDEEE